METIRNIIKKLNERNTEWYNFIDESTEYEKCQDEELKTDFLALLEELKKEVKKSGDRQETRERLKKVLKEGIPEDALVNELLGRVMDITQTYFLFEPLRRIEQEEGSQIEIFLKQLYDDYLIRYDIRFADRFRSFGFFSEEEMMDAAEAVGTLVNIYISNRLSTESILMDFRDETGLSETTSRKFLLYFEKYYQELSTNYIIGMLNAMLRESELLMLSWVVMISPCHAVMRLPGYLSWNVPFDGAAVRPITHFKRHSGQRIPIFYIMYLYALKRNTLQRRPSSITKYCEIIRLSGLGLSQTNIALNCNAFKTTVVCLMNWIVHFIPDVSVSVGRFSPISVNLKSPMPHVCY